MIYPRYLECQRCGAVLRELDAREAAMVAANPMNFELYCGGCRREVSGELLESAR